MENRDLFIAAIVLGSLFAFFASLKVRKIPMEPNHHHHHPHKLIGGCKGTRYGCCTNSNKACANRKCSNCYRPSPRPSPRPHPRPPPTPHNNLIGGCKGTQYGCCPYSREACANIKCSNCQW